MNTTGSTSHRFSAMALGFAALAMLIAMVSLYAGPFAPQQSVGVSLGDIAGDTIRATFRNLRGEEQPGPVARAMTVDDWIGIGVSFCGVLAIVLAIIGLARRESRRMAVGALGLGIGAVAFQFFAWLALAILGVILILGVLGAVGDFFSIG